MSNINIIGKRFYATTKGKGLPELVKAIKTFKEDEIIKVLFVDMNTDKYYTNNLDDFYTNYNSIKPIAVLSLRLVMNRIYGRNIILTINPYDIQESVYTEMNCNYIVYSRFLEENFINIGKELPILSEIEPKRTFLDNNHCCSLFEEDHETHFNSIFIYDKMIVYLYLDDIMNDVIKLLQENDLDRFSKRLELDSLNLKIESNNIDLKSYIKSFESAMYRVLGVIKVHCNKNDIMELFKKFQLQALNDKTIIFADDNKYVLEDIQYHNNIIDCQNLIYDYNLIPKIQMDKREIDFKSVQLKEFSYEDDLDQIFYFVKMKKYVVIVLKTQDNEVLLLKYHIKKIEDELKEETYDERIMTKDEADKFISIISSK